MDSTYSYFSGPILNIHLEGTMSQNVDIGLGPPLSKKLFPVGPVGKNTTSREVGNFFFFPNFIFL